jgi:hypothetical protein
VEGPGALTRAQFRSSFICSLLGTFLIVFIFISFLVWFELSGVFVLLAFIVMVLIAYASLRNTLTLYKLHKDLIDIRTLKKEKRDEQSENEVMGIESNDVSPSPGTAMDKTKSERVWEISGKRPSEAVYLVEEVKRITQPSEKFCYAMFILEFVFLFLWPTITLFMVSWNVAILFVIVAIVSAARHYINAAVLIEETGNMDLVGGSSEKKIWRNKSRLNTIVTTITAGKTKKLWLSILGGENLMNLHAPFLLNVTNRVYALDDSFRTVAGFAYLAIYLGAVGSNTDPNAEGLTYLPKSYYYPPQSDDMRYASCSLTNIRGGFGKEALMLDYIGRLSALLIVFDPSLLRSSISNLFGFFSYGNSCLYQ